MFRIKLLSMVIMISSVFGIVNSTNPVIDGSNQVVYIFAHGLGGNARQVEYYRTYGIIPNTDKYLSENGPEVGVGNSAVVLAQDEDIAVLKKEIESAHQQYGDSCKIVLVGVSKGAATIINTLGRLIQEKSAYTKNIAAAVIESSPADFNDVAFEKFFPRSIPFVCGETISNKLLKIAMQYFVFKSYDPYGLQPIISIQNQWKELSKEMVVVLVHSKEDKLINISHSNKIYQELKGQGFNNLYFIESETGDHANLFWGPSRNVVLKNLWCIYKKHGLPIPEEMLKKSDNSWDSSLKSVFCEINTMSVNDIDQFIGALKI